MKNLSVSDGRLSNSASDLTVPLQIQTKSEIPKQMKQAPKKFTSKFKRSQENPSPTPPLEQVQEKPQDPAILYAGIPLEYAEKPTYYPDPGYSFKNPYQPMTSPILQEQFLPPQAPLTVHPLITQTGQIVLITDNGTVIDKNFLWQFASQFYPIEMMPSRDGNPYEYYEGNVNMPKVGSSRVVIRSPLDSKEIVFPRRTN